MEQETTSTTPEATGTHEPVVEAGHTEPTKAHLPDSTLDAVPEGGQGVSDTIDLNADFDTKLKEAGFDLDELKKEIQESGSITDALVSKVKEKLPPEYVDEHLGRLRSELKKEIQTHKDKVDLEAKTRNKATEDMNDYIYSQTEGEGEFKKMSEYLQANIKQEEIDVLNELLQSGDKDKVNMALDVAKQKYNSLRGRGGLMQGDNNTPAPEFKELTKQEYQQIITTERYRDDRAYQLEIDNRRLKTKTLDQKRYPPGEYFVRTQQGIKTL